MPPIPPEPDSTSTEERNDPSQTGPGSPKEKAAYCEYQTQLILLRLEQALAIINTTTTNPTEKKPPNQTLRATHATIIKAHKITQNLAINLENLKRNIEAEDQQES